MSGQPADELNPVVWLTRARSCRALARAGRGVPDVVLEDLCFHAQQCAEKALKGVLVARSVRFPRTHSIGDLITLLQRDGLTFSNELLAAGDLTVYAVMTRYPGTAPVTDQDYQEAISIAGIVLVWCGEQTGLP